MAQKSQDNIKLEPTHLSFFKPQDKKKISERYLKLISQGSLK